MAKSKKRKKTAKKQTGFFARVFDILTAVVILAIAAGGVYYWVFFDDQPIVTVPERRTAEAVDKPAEIPETARKPVPEEIEIGIDYEADMAERDRLHSEIYHGDDIIAQHEEELLSNITGSRTARDRAAVASYASSIDRWAKKYEGYRLKFGADPDKEKAADNSHLLCAIWRNTAKENDMFFRGYMTTSDILKNIVPVSSAQIRNGDLIVLNNRMAAMITNFRSPKDFSIIYASDSEKKVVFANYGNLVHYWLKPENFRGYFRLNNNILY